jgi:anthranilate synthase/aminodeoxychorismate synthase-like glutamine amidotransferase
MLLVIDNHDSFTWNLVHLLARFADDIEVVQRDAITLAEVRARAPRGIVLAPGSGRPEQADVALELVRALVDVPLLGVCLGHQVLCAALGARVVRAERLMHGRTSIVTHTGEGVFEGVPSPLSVARYHSLVVDAASLPAALRPTAFSETGELMGVRHVARPHEGVQFHPESFMTPHGAALVGRFVSRCARSGLGA